VSALLSKLTRNLLFVKLIGFLFSHASFMLPGKHLAETPHWLAIRHPKPAYPLHILLIPRSAITDWLALPASAPEMYADFIELSQHLIREEGLENKGYRLIVNGGEYQSIPQLHIHLVSGDAYK